MVKDSGLKFSEEFEDLKYVGRRLSCEDAEVQCNRAKNRFTNILPYDLTRVKLQLIEDEEGSDYINANWIQGFHSKREYIATQGPLPATKDDFWRMIWECNAPAIVMLTLCLEKGRVRCDQYWPANLDPVMYGDLEVSILNETISPNWHMREFNLKMNEDSRTLKHFHYLKWPDMNVPKVPQLMEFARLIREKLSLSPLTGPIVVHCSAGVGRTGTFIAIDRVLEQLKEEGEDCTELDVYGIVHNLRMSRVLMVQTEQQYMFIFDCIRRVLDKSKRLSCDDDTASNDYENLTADREDNESVDSEFDLVEIPPLKPAMVKKEETKSDCVNDMQNAEEKSEENKEQNKEDCVIDLENTEEKEEEKNNENTEDSVIDMQNKQENNTEKKEEEKEKMKDEKKKETKDKKQEEKRKSQVAKVDEVIENNETKSEPNDSTTKTVNV